MLRTSCVGFLAPNPPKPSLVVDFRTRVLKQRAYESSWFAVCQAPTSRGPKTTCISGSSAQDKEASRIFGLQDLQVYVVFGP